MINGYLKTIDRQHFSKEGEHVNDGLGSPDSLSFVVDDLCKHRKADHNYFAICKVGKSCFEYCAV